jgi:uncharacterized protein DUF2586
MSVGKANVTNENLSQGPTEEIEKTALYVGVSASGRNAVNAIGPKTDLVNLLGDKASGTLVKQLEAAQLNGGPNFQAYVVGIDDKANYAAAIDLAMATKNVEYIVITDPVTAKAELEAFQTKATAILNALARRVFIVGCAAGINPATQTWAAYQTAMAALTDAVAAARVMVVSNNFGTDLGALAGRLASNKASIADSPMRVITGPVQGLGAKPVDSAGIAYDMAQVTALESERFTCVQWYDDYAGYYFTDGNTLDAEGGDYQAIENLRVVDKAARQVRILAIKRIADRKLNKTKKSQAATKSYLAGPLRTMAKSTKVGGVEFPGEIQEPEDDAISITWTTSSAVSIGMTVTPYSAPKEISVAIALNLSSD